MCISLTAKLFELSACEGGSMHTVKPLHSTIHCIALHCIEESRFSVCQLNQQKWSNACSRTTDETKDMNLCDLLIVKSTMTTTLHVRKGTRKNGKSTASTRFTLRKSETRKMCLCTCTCRLLVYGMPNKNGR